MAYRRGDLETLRALEILLGSGRDATLPDGFDELNLEREMAGATFTIFNERLENLKKSNPYSWQEILVSPYKVANMVNALQEEAENHRQKAGVYTQRLEQLLNGHTEVT
jgi:hypothetical protein